MSPMSLVAVFQKVWVRFGALQQRQYYPDMWWDLVLRNAQFRRHVLIVAFFNALLQVPHPLNAFYKSNPTPLLGVWDVLHTCSCLVIQPIEAVVGLGLQKADELENS